MENQLTQEPELGNTLPTANNSWEKKEVELSFGQKLVGLNFNPSNDVKIQKTKELCAQLADLLNDHYTSKESTPMEQRLFYHAVNEILNAQMNVVKVLSFNY